jgi:hypothetical protein
MIEHPGGKLDRYDFIYLLAVAYRAAFQSVTVSHSFSKAGICSLNRDAIPDEAIAPSYVLQNAEVIEPTTKSPVTNIEDIFHIPLSVKSNISKQGHKCQSVLSSSHPNWNHHPWTIQQIWFIQPWTTQIKTVQTWFVQT